jgi:hypothetical protein
MARSRSAHHRASDVESVDRAGSSSCCARSDALLAAAGSEWLDQCAASNVGCVLLLDRLTRSGCGDSAAFSDVYGATVKVVWAWAKLEATDAADAESLALDAYLEIWREAPRFDASMCGVMPWLEAILVRQQVNVRRLAPTGPQGVAR